MFNRYQRSKTIPMQSLRFQLVKPEEFVRLYNEKGADISSARIVPPQLGNKHFGLILIEWKRPVFAAVYDMDQFACV